MSEEQNIQKIAAYLRSGANEEKRIGLELEHFVYDGEYRMISYDQMADCLRELMDCFGGEAYELDGKLLGVQTQNFALSLEPGCQLEISIAPQEDVDEIGRIYDEFRRAADPVFERLGFSLHTGAVLPQVADGTLEPEAVELIPKERYRVMDAHFSKTGSCGSVMMRATASTQVSIDFSDEADALRKARLLEKLAPLLMLLTEQREELHPSKRWLPHLLRAQVWSHVDPARCGYLPDSLSPDYSFETYASWLYHTDSILIRQNGLLQQTDGKSAAECYGDRAIEDIDYLLSMFFPHVRLKKYIEYRIADSMPIDEALSFAKLVQEIAYNEAVMADLEQQLAGVQTIGQLQEAEHAIEAEGWSAKVYGKPVCQWMDAFFDCLAKHVSDEACRQELFTLRPLALLEYQYEKNIRGHEREHGASDLAIREYLSHSTAKYHERVVRTLYLPKLFSRREVGLFEHLTRQLYDIFDRVIEHFVEDESYRALFGFPRELEKLILMPPHYETNVPMARIDLFYNEDTGEYQFCEFNTDGASAMNEDRELNIAFSKSLAYRKFAQNHTCSSFELFDSWVAQALKIFGEAVGDDQEKPRVAIVDFLENATINEFYIFKEAFERAGCQVCVCDIRDLKYDGEVCYTEEFGDVELVYRRAVTSDILAHFSEVDGFLEAYRDGGICLVGDFRTQIVHNKILFKVLHMDETMEFLSEQQRAFVRAHVPFTMSLGELFDGSHEQLRAQVLQEKNNWIIKPEDSYGSKGLHAGVELSSDEEWQQALLAAKDEAYVLQRFCTPYRLENLRFDESGPHWVDVANLTGLFVYNGQLSGLYSRISFDQVISTQYNEMTIPTIVVD